jgi:hypothetical protein
MKDERKPVVTREDLDEAEEPRAQTREPEPPTPETPESKAEPQRAERTEGDRAGLFESDRAKELQRRWADVQARFVDDPKAAVKSADGLVDEVIRDLSALFSDERSKLEAQWDSNADVSTEDLRVAIRRYRAFFERLLSI